MIIKSLSVVNFRNHAASTLTLSEGVNILVGDNAQGKTNLLEAVYLTCVGRGCAPRFEHLKDLVRNFAAHSMISTGPSPEGAPDRIVGRFACGSESSCMSHSSYTAGHDFGQTDGTSRQFAQGKAEVSPFLLVTI